MAPSQTLPDHAPEPLKFSATPVTRLVEEDEEDDGSWSRTLRPAALDHSPTVPRLVPLSQRIAHSRDSSAEKLQQLQSAAAAVAGGGLATSPSAASSTSHPLLHSSSSRTALNGVIERVVDPKAAAYGHHRQTSIVHGIQHSRNGSVASTSSSPLSPQMIAAVGAALVAERSEMQSSAFSRLDGDLSPAAAAISPPLSAAAVSRPPTAMSGNTATSIPSVNGTGSGSGSGGGSTSNMAGPGPVVPERTSSAMDGSISASQRKPEHMHSGKYRHEHAHHHSHSRHKDKDEQKTVGDYALHVLFTSFIAIAEEKLNANITPFDPEPHIEQIMGPGADAAFDQHLTALGHISKQKPKPLIDSMMLWRKSISEKANVARSSLQQMRIALGPVPLQRRNTEPLQTGASNGGPMDHGTAAASAMAAKQEEVATKERWSTVSIYVLCRVLLEVMTQSSLASITPEMEDKLEGIIFGQLKMADAEQLMLSPLRMANWNLFAELLGAMSDISFPTVTGRFINDLERSLQETGVRSPVLAGRSDGEERMELVLSGMKYIRLKLAPPEAWDQSCEFMVAMGRLFSRCHGQKVKAAFCHILEQLFLPVAAHANNNDFCRPKWGEVLSTISPRLAQLYMKPRHWASAFPLMATMICTSPSESFGNQWLQLVYPLQTRLKDRASKAVCLQVLSRLVWTYLYRTTDTSQNTIRKLEEVLKLVLPNTKRPVVATETAIVEPLIQIIRFIGFKHPDYCFKSIIFPLVNADLFTSNRDLRVENLEPDKIVVGIRAFLAVVGDLERGEAGRPPFPLPSGENSGINAEDDDQLARPILAAALSENVREYCARFCEILGKMTLVCDNTFGGQAALDEKFASPGPKTPMADTFNFRRDEHAGPMEQKQSFYELLHVAVQALPRCLSADMPFNSLVNLLCTGTAHVQSNIAESSAHSLKAIARQSHAQQVTMGFSRFIFNFDDRYTTMSDGGMLGPDHIENTLRLYVELLQIWIEEIRRKTEELSTAEAEEGNNASDQRGLKLDLSSIWAEVDQVEAHGLFFLCSQSRRVRHFAITVLRLITEFDAALGKAQTGKMAEKDETDVGGGETEETDGLRVIEVLERESATIMDFNDEYLTVAERSRLQRGLRGGDQGAVLELCTSDLSYDATLWFKVFPNLIRVINARCVFAVMIGRDLICSRILQMYKAITIISEPARGPFYGADPVSARFLAQTPTTQPELLVEQWRLYLVFACTTLADGTGVPAPTGNTNGNSNGNGNGTSGAGQHGRRGSKGTGPGTVVDRIVTARTLFKYLNPLLSAASTSVREAVVAGMGSINRHIYRTLLEELQGHVSRCNDEARARIHQRTNSSPRRNRKMDLLRTEITHVYRLTAHFLREAEVYSDEWIMGNLVTYARDIKLFLMDGEVQLDMEFQRLRRHYCGLMEELYAGIGRTRDPSRWMTFEARKSAFTLMEDWCGFLPGGRDDRGRLSVGGNGNGAEGGGRGAEGERGTLTAAMEIEKRHLRTAALSAMASLCGGPIGVTTESGVSLQFDVRRMFAWIEGIFTSGNDRMRMIGRQALSNMIVHNREHSFLLDHSISRCYATELARVLESYFDVVTQVLLDHADYPTPIWRLLGLCLFTLGNEQAEVRSRSLRMLRGIEGGNSGSGGDGTSKMHDFDISVADKTKAVYKLAQYKISERLSKQHTELAFHVFSEFTLYFKDLQPAAQRNAIAVLLPWVQSVELKVEAAGGGPTAESYVLLANLLEITIRSSGALHNEVQALWQALATGPHPGNVRLILDFIMALCLERREQNFVEYAKQIVVFLASTSSAPGQKVVDFLLMQITPKAMVPNEKRETVGPGMSGMVGMAGMTKTGAGTETFPYCADLNEALPVGTKQAGFSLGQLSLILLVDLMVSPVHLTAEQVPVLLQVLTVLWDHYTPLVQEQAREMLVHLVHELVIAGGDERGASAGDTRVFEDLVERIRQHDKTVVWAYEDSNGKADEPDSKVVPPGMELLTATMVRAFETTFPGIKEQWGRLSLTWATSCPVRHLACRSFQIFRCVLTSLDQYMLAEMLARLSNTIADEDSEIRTFSMEILTTLKTLIVKLEPERLLAFPQLFWTMCACLESINEREFLEAVEMLNGFLDKLDWSDPVVRQRFRDGQPAKWDSTGFDGLQPLLFKGLRSSLCLDATLRTLDKLVRLPSDELVGYDDRLFLTLVAHLPEFLRCMETTDGAEKTGKTGKADKSDNPHKLAAQTLCSLALAQGFASLARVLDNWISGSFGADATAFVEQILAALQEHDFLPRHDFQMLVMLMGLLTNSLAWVRLQTMRLLCIVIPRIDMRQPEIAGCGSDLLSPLLRLLPTSFCMDALHVLDKILILSGSAMDAHHIRMSMTRSTTDVRKEYDRTQSLFGIPEDSGWAIPMPAKKTDATRANIRRVFYTCLSAEGAEGDVAPEATPTPEVEFHNEEFPYGTFVPPAMERTDTMLSDGAAGAGVGVGGGIGNDLVTKLDSLHDFFDDDLGLGGGLGGGPGGHVVHDMHDMHMHGLHTPHDGGDGDGDGDGSGLGPAASRAQLYDEIAPLLHQASNPATGLHNAFADRPPGSRDGQGPAYYSNNNTMNPGAFNFGLSTGSGPGPSPGPSPGVGVAGGLRPALHTRSITSPSAPAAVASVAASSLYLRDFASSDDDDDEGEADDVVFSDNDDERIATGGLGGSISGSGSGSGSGIAASIGSALTTIPTSSSSQSLGNHSISNHSVSNHSESFFYENMIRPLAQSTRSRMRRLTSSRSRDDKNERSERSERNDLGGGPGPGLGPGGLSTAGSSAGSIVGTPGTPGKPVSPLVPKVPTTYLKEK